MVLMTEQRCEAEEPKAGRAGGRRECRGALRLSDGENGTDERRKPGKSPTLLLQTPTGEVEHTDDRKKVDVARTKSSSDSPVLTTDIKNDSKIERKKRASNQLKANAHFHKLFLDVPIDEPLKQSFTCALQKEILYQGKLFLSENWICFHSKVFGKDTKSNTHHSYSLLSTQKKSFWNESVTKTLWNKKISTSRKSIVEYLLNNCFSKDLTSEAGQIDLTHQELIEKWCPDLRA